MNTNISTWRVDNDFHATVKHTSNKLNLSEVAKKRVKLLNDFKNGEITKSELADELKKLEEMKT